MKTLHSGQSRLGLCLLAVAIVLLVTGCDAFESDSSDRVDDQRVLATTSVDESIHLSNEEALSLQNVNGDVEIVASGRGSMIHIKAELIAGSESREDAEWWLDKLQVRIEKRARVIAVMTDFPNDSKGRRLEVRYQVRIPEGIDVDVAHINGNVTISDVVGHVDIDHMNGRIDINNLHGTTDVHLINGTIACSMYMDADGFAFLNTVNGRIELDIPSNTSALFHAGTTNGRVDFKDLALHGETGNARERMGTLGGGHGRIELKVVNGDIDVRGM